MTNNIPTHLGLILDGNRRWAKNKGLPTLKGHERGYANFKTIADLAFKKGIKYVSAYTFSTENWNRSKKEVDYLMNLIFTLFKHDLKKLNKDNVKIIWLGNLDRLSDKVKKAINEAVETTKNNTGGNLCICFNYGGQLEITDAVKKIVNSGIDAKDITEQTVADNLYHPEVPPVNIIVRTSGELRLSNFMLWRAAYSELMFFDKHWPDFNESDLDKVIAEYSRRQRRFGA